VRLAGQFFSYALVNGAWWLIPLLVVLMAATLLVAAGQAVAPFTLYTVF
jgi:hypothetical protein